MECSSCHQENPPEAEFCARCGSSLAAPGVRECPQCRHGNSPDAQFCTNCAAALIGGCPSCSRQDVRGGLFCQWCNQFLVGPVGIKAAGLGRRAVAYILDIVLFSVTLVIGYIIWWLITLRWGQTPGKQLLGIRVMRADGRRSDWGWTFLREFVIKLLVFEVVGDVVTSGIASLVDLLWAFLNKDCQTIHDKIVKTVVVDDQASHASTG